MADWQPIETVPEGEVVLLYWPQGEKGRGGMETAMVFWTREVMPGRLLGKGEPIEAMAFINTGAFGDETPAISLYEAVPTGTRRLSFWTHGGPNSGSDWEPNWLDGDECEMPTHWMPLPQAPGS